ncbi:hypothetical protein BD626DRAFT_497028, partial [Schizophyllum amplum]
PFTARRHSCPLFRLLVTRAYCCGLHTPSRHCCGPSSRQTCSHSASTCKLPAGSLR